MTKSLVGIVGSGLLGADPFDRRTWSGSSFHFFSTLKARGRLHRAFGVEAPKWRRRWLMAKNFYPRRATWRRRYHLDLDYRRALTAEVSRRLTPDDFEHDFLQVGAFYDVPSLRRGAARCFSYHDGNLAVSLRSPNSPPNIGAKVIDRALAFERDLYSRLDRMFTMSEFIRQSFIKDFDVSPDKVVAVGGGMNLETMPDPLPGKRYDADEILFIGIEFERKGGWELLEAFRIVRERRPKAKLHIVGPRELAVPDNLAGGVMYHGYLSKSDPVSKAKLDALFRSASLFVMPSRYEPFGIAPLEAMVYEVPAVVTGQWALRELVTPGETGAHVECGDVEGIAATLTSLLADPDALARMGRAGRQYVLSRYTWDRVVDRLLAHLPADSAR